MRAILTERPVAEPVLDELARAILDRRRRVEHRDRGVVEIEVAFEPAPGVARRHAPVVRETPVQLDRRCLVDAIGIRQLRGMKRSRRGQRRRDVLDEVVRIAVIEEGVDRPSGDDRRGVPQQHFIHVGRFDARIDRLARGVRVRQIGDERAGGAVEQRDVREETLRRERARAALLIHRVIAPVVRVDLVAAALPQVVVHADARLHLIAEPEREERVPA